MRDFALILHFLGLVMGMGTPIAFLFLSKVANRMGRQESFAFTLNSFVLSKMGHIGYTLLILSGLYLIIPYWDSLDEQPLLIAKLILVILLGAFIGIASASMRRARSEDPAQHINKIRRIGPLALITGISILVISVLIFH